MKTLSVFLLSAGHGKRLAPLTNRIPKPLIPFLGHSAFDRNIQVLKQLNPKKILCNAHHLAKQIEEKTKEMGITCVHEEELLGTGGALANATQYLEDTDYFLVCNSDVIHNIDLIPWVQKCYNEPNFMGHLITLQQPGTANTMVGNSQNFFCGVSGVPGWDVILEPNGFTSTFSGIGLYHHSFLNYTKSGIHDIKPFWKDALNSGHHFKLHPMQAQWYDFGTPQGLWDTFAYIMDKEKQFSYGYRDPKNPKPMVSVECEISLQNELKNVIWLEPNSPLDSHFQQNKIIGQDFEWEIDPK